MVMMRDCLYVMIHIIIIKAEMLSFRVLNYCTKFQEVNHIVQQRLMRTLHVSGVGAISTAVRETHEDTASHGRGGGVDTVSHGRGGGVDTASHGRGGGVDTHRVV